MENVLHIEKNTQKIPPVTVKLFYIISQDYC